MSRVNQDYSRDAALRNGYLIDVSDLASRLGILFPVAVSVSLYNHPAMSPKFRTYFLEELVQMALGSARWLAGDTVGEREYGVCVSDDEWSWPILARVVVEPSALDLGVVATIFVQEEVPSLVGLAATFFVN